MTRNYAPIALFTYNRFWHTQQTVESLARNKYADESDLTVYSDAAKSPNDKRAVVDVRQFLKTIRGFKSVCVVEQEQNLGLATSIISGVSKVVDQFGRVIVLEDDMVTSPFFLKYMNDALEFYQDDDRVISIHGYSFPIENLPEAFFLKGAGCWGWATWKRGWELFEGDGKKLLSSLEDDGLVDRFNIFGAYPYKKMLLKQIHGKNDSWAVRWYASALIRQKLTLYPGLSLVRNIGLDGSGKHCGRYDGFDPIMSDAVVQLDNIEVKENEKVLNAWYHFLKRQQSTIEKAKRFIKMIIH